MTNRRLSAFIDGLVSGRRSGSFRASPDDAEVLRMAIALRASRPGDAAPDKDFVAGLYEDLAAATSSPPDANVVRLKAPRRIPALAAVAAGVVLVAATAGATDAINHAVAPVAVPAPYGQVLRTATFETAGHRALGQVVAYSGHPSWVFMNVDVANYNGRIMCMLQATAVLLSPPVPSTSIVAWGNFRGLLPWTSAGSGGRGSSPRPVPL